MLSQPMTFNIRERRARPPAQDTGNVVHVASTVRAEQRQIEIEATLRTGEDTPGDWTQEVTRVSGWATGWPRGRRASRCPCGSPRQWARSSARAPAKRKRLGGREQHLIAESSAAVSRVPE
jgi:hypothetical protein